MKKIGMIWFGAVLAFIAAGSAVGVFIDFGGSRVGSGVIAVIFAAGAWRAWHLAGEDSTKPPTEVEG